MPMGGTTRFSSGALLWNGSAANNLSACLAPMLAGESFLSRYGYSFSSLLHAVLCVLNTMAYRQMTTYAHFSVH